MHFKVGYIVDAIASVITDFKFSLDKNNPNDNNQLNQINGLLQYVTSFEVEFPYQHTPNFKKLNPVIATLNNIITRGLPTRAPLILEKLFCDISLTEPNENEFTLNFPILKNAISYETIFELLHIIEPDLEITKDNYGGNLGSNLEWSFIKKHPFLKQILESQRDFSTINQKLQGERTVDFSFTSPYLHWNEANCRYENIGRIFEVDGPHHQLYEYKYYDTYRDAIAEDENFETIRFSVESIKDDKTDLESLIGRKIYRIFKKNFDREFGKYLKEYTLLFVPIAVARIQKTIIELLLVQPNLFEEEKIKIAIIERDFPCGAIAIKSLQELFLNINAILEGKDKLHLPTIELTVFENPKWVLDKRLHLNVKTESEDFFQRNIFDIVIDHSILRRSNIYKEVDYQYSNAIKIRSSHYNNTLFGQSRRVYCADLLSYKSLVKKKDDGSYKSIKKYEKHINYFIQTLFRKVKFREGQLPIISRALQQKPVIGLLPTGGGKSLTFQLPTLLQPGLCLVVDPIKSLMEDQVRVLKENWIDCCDFINSNLKREVQAKKLIDFRYGETMFLFVSPERFVMDDFRTIIQKIDLSVFGLAFSYCVIDEVHCVSEWGHDFRSTYLMLGKNAQQFLTVKNPKKRVSLIGLTATASFDVLADIEREIEIQHNDVADAIIMIENTIRPELFFRVIDVTDKDRITELNNDFSNLGKNLDKLNNKELIEKSKEHHHKNFNKLEKFSKSILFQNEKGDGKILDGESQDKFYSIVFCPVKGTGRSVKGEIMNELGVDYVYEKLESNSKGYYYSSDTEHQNKEIQKHFQNFTTDRTKHIVCTKAFGMGIDKADIRSTYHYVYSSSLESLVQECGRAGRDKKISEATILVSKNKYYKLDIYKFFRDNSDNKLLQNKFTRKAIRQAFEKKWNDNIQMFEDVEFPNLEELLKTIKLVDFSLINQNGNIYNLIPTDSIVELRNNLRLKNEDDQYQYIIEKYNDRDVFDFFHELSFKGVDVEKSQLLNLFQIEEFQLLQNKAVNIQGQDTLAKTFTDCKQNTFKFILTETKTYKEADKKICSLLEVEPTQNPEFTIRTYQELVNSAFNYSNDFDDFLFILEENNVIKNLSEINQLTKDRLLFVYSRDRESANETGRLIYRMNSMGFLVDYLIDYNKINLYTCTFIKHKSIDKYVSNIETYLRRYLSENTALKKIEDLKKRLNKSTIIDNILECLYFLSEFSYTEIASKRKRATNEIEKILNTSITETQYTSDWFQQNLFIKEQIYFYFNAKYARIGFKIERKPYSLLDDYKEHSLSKNKILYKYLQVFHLDGTEQNNYKHMTGSCKKILSSLSESDLNKEWVLRLLKAFSMYSVNNSSYISEANSELEFGFTNLYEDDNFHQNNFESIQEIFEKYFEKLQNNIQKDNPSFKVIKLIRAKLLLKMQVYGIDKLVNKNLQLKKERHA